MWTVLLVVYVAGIALTALSVLRNRVFSQGTVVNAASAALWPVYWSLFLTSFLLNRSPGRSGRPSK